MELRTSSGKRISFAACLTLVATAYAVTAIPYLQHGIGFRELRSGLLAVQWKSDWPMFAPGPRRTFPRQLVVRYFMQDGSALHEEVLFDAFQKTEHWFFKGTENTHGPLFYTRLWDEIDCPSNCERLLDAAVRRKRLETGQRIQRAQLVWSEVRVRPWAQAHTKRNEIALLAAAEKVKLEKTYDP